MGQPVVHFEVIGQDPEALRSYYGELFGWEFDTSGSVSPAVSEPANYGFVAARRRTIRGWRRRAARTIRTGCSSTWASRTSRAALQQAESLGGTRRMGPDRAPGRDLVVGHFTDPEGNLIGVAGTA